MKKINKKPVVLLSVISFLFVLTLAPLAYADGAVTTTGTQIAAAGGAAGAGTAGAGTTTAAGTGTAAGGAIAGGVTTGLVVGGWVGATVLIIGAAASAISDSSDTTTAHH